MRQHRGFTLVELLVVIAIISILAAIVVPQVTGYIARGRMAKAVSEIQGIELAVTALLTDVGRSNLRQIFNSQAPGLQPVNPADPTLAEVAAATDIYTNAMYIILRQGRTGAQNELTGIIDSKIIDKLGGSYMDLGLDPWGNKYRFYAGPWRAAIIPFRSWRPGVETADDYRPYLYDATAKLALDNVVPGNPQPDDQPGFPAPHNLPVYIWSEGQDMQGSQLIYNVTDPELLGGGDDINNWDNQSGWSSWYTR